MIGVPSQVTRVTWGVVLLFRTSVLAILATYLPHTAAHTLCNITEMPNMQIRGLTSRPNAVSACGRTLRTIPAQALVPARWLQQNVGRSVAAASGASTAPAPVDDKNVPEAHRGLHGFLYGEGGAEEHDAVGSYAVRKVSRFGRQGAGNRKPLACAGQVFVHKSQALIVA